MISRIVMAVMAIAVAALLIHGAMKMAESIAAKQQTQVEQFSE